MEETIRLTKIEIKDLKNVSFGIIDFKENITGIYGQNGSGKTALVDAMNILKSVLCSKNLDFAYDLISINSEVSELNFHFDVTISEKKYKTVLELVLAKTTVLSNEGEQIKKITLKKEIIRYTEFSSNKNSRKKILIGTTEKETLKNNDNLKELISKHKVDLIVTKKLSETNSTSFLFNPLLIELLSNLEENKSNKFINAFRKFGLIDLIIITNENLGVINLNTIFPLTVKTNRSVGNFIITDQNIVIEENLCDEVHKIISQINIVLNSIIPNMSLELFEKNKEFVESDKINVVLQLISIRDNKKIPFKNESAGIKKIVSILSALITTYNDKKVCLVIDELDSGIFEYLLGELLTILEDGINGQLIFTSHNLRILEKLNKDSLVFTTTNKDNRYIRLKNIKTTNNLRDFYIREMTMQEQNETLYEETNNGDIEFALYEAGVLDGNN